MARRPGTLTLRTDDGRIVCESVRVADTFTRRLRGLWGRSTMRTGEGVVLRPAWSIHTGFMRFPIDVVFLDPDQVVIHIEPAVKPWRTASCRAAREVIELPAGECDRRGLEIGDHLAWAPVAQELAHGLLPPQPSRGAARVVVASTDRRFTKVMRFLLERQGIEADAASGTDLVAMIEQRGASVVVLDASPSVLDAGRAVGAVGALYPAVQIVVVADAAGRDGGASFPVLDKWEGMDQVVEQVAQAVGAPSAA